MISAIKNKIGEDDFEKVRCTLSNTEFLQQIWRNILYPQAAKEDSKVMVQKTETNSNIIDLT